MVCNNSITLLHDREDSIADTKIVSNVTFQKDLWIKSFPLVYTKPCAPDG